MRSESREPRARLVSRRDDRAVRVSPRQFAEDLTHRRYATRETTKTTDGTGSFYFRLFCLIGQSVRALSGAENNRWSVGDTFGRVRDSLPSRDREFPRGCVKKKVTRQRTKGRRDEKRLSRV